MTSGVGAERKQDPRGHLRLSATRSVKRRTIRTRVRAKLGEVKAELRRRLHRPIPEVGSWLGSVVTGHCRYYGVAGNFQALSAFRYQVGWLWHRSLERRSQTAGVTWLRMARLLKRWLPRARIYHPYQPVRQLQMSLA